MLVVLDRQHLGKPSKPGDHGAIYGALRETDLTDGYIAAARASLERHGHDVQVLAEGEYGPRQRSAVALARLRRDRVAYVACHVNAGGGTYALAEYDERSEGGCELAHAVAALKQRGLPGITAQRTAPLGPGSRGWVCIAGIYAGPPNLSGVIFEPGFIDAPSHAPLWTAAGLVQVGEALAAGCMAWGNI